MNLRTIAEEDLAVSMESEESFRWSIVLTDPDGHSNTEEEPLYGTINDVSGLIDPETGQFVSGRIVAMAIRISSLDDLGFGIPEGESNSNKKPWFVVFKDITGSSHVMKVSRGDPDLTLGIVNLYLEVYKRVS
jgi:hypothetical protein